MELTYPVFMGIATLVVLAILALAFILTIASMVLAWRESHHRRSDLRNALLAQLERERAVHDRVKQMPLPEEADDYIEAMSQRAPWRHVDKGRGSAITGNRA